MEAAVSRISKLGLLASLLAMGFVLIRVPEPLKFPLLFFFGCTASIAGLANTAYGNGIPPFSRSVSRRAFWLSLLTLGVPILMLWEHVA